jgi:hypothetical protein
MPLNPVFVERYADPATLEDYHGRIKNFADLRSLPMIDLNEAASLESSDFVDSFHVVGEDARNRCGRAISEGIIAAGLMTPVAGDAL